MQKRYQIEKDESLSPWGRSALPWNVRDLQTGIVVASCSTKYLAETHLRELNNLHEAPRP